MRATEVAKALGITLWTPVYVKGKGVAMKQTDDGSYLEAGEIRHLLEAAAKTDGASTHDSPSEDNQLQQPVVAEEGEPELQRICPDDGTCHHDCRAGECWRVHNAAPLSEYGEQWPSEIVTASAERRLTPPSSDQSKEEGGR